MATFFVSSVCRLLWQQKIVVTVHCVCGAEGGTEDGGRRGRSVLVLLSGALRGAASGREEWWVKGHRLLPNLHSVLSAVHTDRELCAELTAELSV